MCTVITIRLVHREHGLYENQTVGLDVLDKDQQQLKSSLDDQSESGSQQRVQPLNGRVVLDDAVHAVHVQHYLSES